MFSWELQARNIMGGIRWTGNRPTVLPRWNRHGWLDVKPEGAMNHHILSTLISNRKQPLQLQQWPALTSSAPTAFGRQENKASAGLRTYLVTSLGWLTDLSGRPPLLVKQPSWVACSLEELKCWGAWNTPHKQQSQGHHTINHLEERGVERGST